MLDRDFIEELLNRNDVIEDDEAAILAEIEADRHSAICPCGRPKTPGEYLCAPCFKLEEAEANTDWEEVERQEALLRVLPSGTYTASEMREYLE